jgi:hypothetical protein
MCVGMSVVLLIGMLADLLFLQAGIDGFGRFQRVEASVLSIDETQYVERATRSGALGAIYKNSPALRYSFEFTFEGKPIRSNRAFLIGRSLEIPQHLLKANTAIANLRVGDKVLAYYIPSTDTAFLAVGLWQALKFWISVYISFAVLFAIGGAIISLGLRSRSMSDRKR